MYIRSHESDKSEMHVCIRFRVKVMGTIEIAAITAILRYFTLLVHGRNVFWLHQIKRAVKFSSIYTALTFIGFSNCFAFINNFYLFIVG